MNNRRHLASLRDPRLVTKWTQISPGLCKQFSPISDRTKGQTDRLRRWRRSAEWRNRATAALPPSLIFWRRLLSHVSSISISMRPSSSLTPLSLETVSMQRRCQMEDRSLRGAHDCVERVTQIENQWGINPLNDP